MEKLEKHIKEKLEARKLSPSKDAWAKVASSLGETDKKKARGTYWYAVAASIIGLLIITAVYFNKQDEKEPNIQIVNTTNTTREDSVSNKEQITIVDNTSAETQKLVEKVNTIDADKVPFFKEESKQEYKDIAAIKRAAKVKEAVQDSFVKASQEDLVIQEKITEVLATVIDLESMSEQITDAEVDSLLRLAQQDILKEKVFKNTGKVDAMALLTEVEDELDQSFRDKIFIKLKEGLFKARTAVADRNN